MRYEDENIWLTQRMMAQLYDVPIQNIGQHIKKIYEDGELTQEAAIKKFFIVQNEAERQIPTSMENWAKRMDGFSGFNGNEILTDAGKISAEQAEPHAETEFEKYRIVQDRLFMSDYDKFLLELEEQAKNEPD